METISTMNQNPPKATGMPLGIKILIILIIIGFGGLFFYTKFLMSVPTQAPVTETYTKLDTPYNQRIADHKGNVITAKCKDFENIGLYLESDITYSDYTTILVAIATIPSASLVIPNQELTFKSETSKIKVYKCQVSKGVLMGKIVTISKKPIQ